MANLVRKQQKVFAENAINNGQFGSLQATTKITTTDTDVIQALAAFLEGWNSAVISGEELPALEEFQGLHFLTTRQISYLLDKGIPEWEIATEYFIGDIQREVGGTKLYRSITDNNTGNIVTDVVNWLLLGDLADLIAAAPATTITSGTAFLPKIIIVSNGADADHDLLFAAGVMNPDDGSEQAATTALIKQIDAPWVAGDDVGGLFSGAVAPDTTYYCFSIYDPILDIADAGMSNDPTAADIPAGFTKKELVMKVLTDGSSNIINHSLDGDYVWFAVSTAIEDFNGGPSATLSPITISVPADTTAVLSLFYKVSNGATGGRSIFFTDNNSGQEVSTINSEDIGASDQSPNNTSLIIGTDSNSEVQYRVNNASSAGILIVRTRGFIFKR